MRATYGLACALTAAVAAGSAQATFVHFDLNSIRVDAGAAFDGVTHTGTLELSSGANSTLNAIELNGVNMAMSGDLSTLDGEIVLVNGQVAGGFIRFSASDGAEYLATIGGQAGQVNPQAGHGFRIDGLTHTGLFDELFEDTMFAGVDLSSKLGLAELIELDGSFLLHSFGPSVFGFDSVVDLDVYADVPVPAPGPAALGAVAAALGSRRRRNR